MPFCCENIKQALTMLKDRQFYVLSRSPIYVRRVKGESPSYWSHMTLTALEVYEKIYRDIVTMYPKDNGYVSCK